MNTQHEFHNPDNLTPEQIGDGYRLLLKSEMGPGPYDPRTKQMEFWSGDYWLQPATSVWSDRTYRVPLSTWHLSEEEWKLGRSVNGFTLADGQEWHRLDGWTKDMLPDGWRPLVIGEPYLSGDEFLSQLRGIWLPETYSGKNTVTKNELTYKRTRRPLPLSPRERAESQAVLDALTKNDLTGAEGWIPWHGGECPLKDEEVEEFEYQLSDKNKYIAISNPSDYRWRSNGEKDDIIAYQVLKWKEKPKITGQTGPADMPNKCGPSSADFEPAPTDNDRWESLLRTNSMLEKRVKELEKKCSKINEVKARANALIATHEKLQSKLTAAQARLEQLEWRPISVKPTKEDADSDRGVIVTDGKFFWRSHFDCIEPQVTQWRPAALPTIPDQSRVEFEKWAAQRSMDLSIGNEPDRYSNTYTDLTWSSWKAARKEGVQ